MKPNYAVTLEELLKDTDTLYDNLQENDINISKTNLPLALTALYDGASKMIEDYEISDADPSGVIAASAFISLQEADDDMLNTLCYYYARFAKPFILTNYMSDSDFVKTTALYIMNKEDEKTGKEDNHDCNKCPVKNSCANNKNNTTENESHNESNDTDDIAIDSFTRSLVSTLAGYDYDDIEKYAKEHNTSFINATKDVLYGKIEKHFYENIDSDVAKKIADKYPNINLFDTFVNSFNEFMKILIDATGNIEETNAIADKLKTFAILIKR